MPFGLGPGELFLGVLILLLLFGAKRIPEIGSGLGKGIREFKRSFSEVERQISEPEREERITRAQREAERLPEKQDDDDRPEPKRLLS